MTKKPTTKSEHRRIRKETLDLLLEEAGGPEALLGSGGLAKELMAALIERALQGELTHHLDYEAGEVPPEEQSNRRNGASRKVIRTDQGELDIQVPRDREGTYTSGVLASSQDLARFCEDITAHTPPPRHKAA